MDLPEPLGPVSATLVFVGSDRLRRTITVRRLHGIGFARSYRELLAVIGATWAGQALVAGIALAAYEIGSSGRRPGDEAQPLALLPELLAVLAAAAVIEILLAAAVATVLERRHAVKRLKEM